MVKTPRFASFSSNIAAYGDARDNLLLLLLSMGFEKEEAAEFTPHSFRHWLPTLAGQLEVPKDDVAEIGHWDVLSGMPATYDSVGCARELAVKNKLFRQWQAGWRPVAQGQIPPGPVPGSSLKAVQHYARGSSHWY